MTLEEKKDLQDKIVNALIGIRGFLDILPRAFDLYGYDINAKIAANEDDTIKECIFSSYDNIQSIYDYLNDLKVTEIEKV